MKVAIVGFGGAGLVRPLDRSWKVWGLNGGHRVPELHWTPAGFRADAWFQIHPPEACNAAELDWFRVLPERRVATYVREEDIPHWTRAYPEAAEWLRPFPLAMVKQHFPDGWYANTFCLEAALALSLDLGDDEYAEDLDALAFLGVDCTDFGREVAVERPAVAYWIGAAHALGVRVEVHDGSTLLYREVYGFDYWAEARKAAEVTEVVLPLDLVERAEHANLDTVAAVDAAEDKAHAGR